MRITGIILIVAGILMMVFSGFNFTSKEKVLDIGPIQVNKEKEHHIGWPVWTGGIAVLAGIGLVVAGRKK